MASLASGVQELLVFQECLGLHRGKCFGLEGIPSSLISVLATFKSG